MYRWENAFKKQITFFQHKINTGEYTKQDYVMARLNTMLDHSSGFYIKVYCCYKLIFKPIV